MRRALVAGIALALLSTWIALPAGARSTLTCAHPTTLTGYEDGVAYPRHLRVNQDVWTQQGTQTMSVCSPSSWTATVTQSGAPATGVKTYPDSEATDTDWATCASQHRLDSFTTLTSKFGMTLPHAGSWDEAYDMYVGGGACPGPSTEVMIWSKWRNVSVPAAQLHATIGGVAYDVFHSGSYIAVRRVEQVSAGSVNMLAVFRYLASQHLIDMAKPLVFRQMGVEVLTTFGKPLDFAMTRFSVSSS